MVNPGGKAYGHPMPNHPKHHGYHPNVPGAVGKTLYLFIIQPVGIWDIYGNHHY